MKSAAEAGRPRVLVVEDEDSVRAFAVRALASRGYTVVEADSGERGLEVIRTGQSIQRTLEPGDLVGTIAWLLGDGSQFVTGQTIAVDGGTVLL